MVVGEGQVIVRDRETGVSECEMVVRDRETALRDGRERPPFRAE